MRGLAIKSGQTRNRYRSGDLASGHHPKGRVQMIGRRWMQHITERSK